MKQLITTNFTRCDVRAMGESAVNILINEHYIFAAEDIKQLRKYLKKLQKQLEDAAFYAKVDAMEESFPD